MNKADLAVVLEKHVLWLRCATGGTRADLSWADLTGVDLTGVDLSWADLSWADLTEANMTEANMTEANMTGANMTGANLTGANLTGANLTKANLYKANLYKANLYKANLYKANLYGRTPLFADTKRRYVLYVINANVRFYVAGCRCFTKEEALAHWGMQGRSQPEYVAAIERYEQQFEGGDADGDDNA